MDLVANLNTVRERIAAACARAHRDPGTITLVAVSKSHPPETVRAAADCGLAVFGESRVQEAKAKISLCPERLQWHLIGHLQSNKCRDAIQCFAMIHSVDNLHLAQELNKWAEKAGRTMPILLEANIAGESSKFGYPPERLLAELEALNALTRIELHGLMTIAPWTPDPEKVRLVFGALRQLKEQCDARLGVPLPHLSMGMSGDFEVAIEEGATIVRLGTVLFGDRTGKAWRPTTQADENE